ncbi:MAG: Gfo/Idh/MocA family oxidoreductase [Acidobacteriaceae bacterium]|nr:Gfo/Idh/MocA family oxidoreductase [Acidobacteriaceae bacterium]
MDRRDFLRAGASGVVLGSLSEYARAVPDEKPRRVGLIGCGWYGKIDLIRLIQVAPVEVVSLCDVDSNMLQNAANIIGTRQKSKKRPRTYGDYRQMLGEKDLDIVLIATPDHWHALTMIEAAKAGADIYVQKPISVDLAEGEAMVAAARKYGRVVQVGTQRRSTPHITEARERYIVSGALGKISFVEIYCYYHMRATGNPPDTDPPNNLNYEMWTGPAPMRPYNKLVHPRTWRAFMEYGNGIVGDMCVHMLDMTRWFLGLGWPTQIASTGGILVDKASKANITDTQTATFDYPELRVVWQHRSWGEANDPHHPWGATFYGEKGTLKVDVYGYDYTPLGGKTVHRAVTYEFQKYPEDRTEKDLERHVAPAIRYHMLNFLEAIDRRSKPIADIEEGHISTASCILANDAMKLGRTIQWDAGTQRAVGDEEANALLWRSYREPWQHPAPAYSSSGALNK